MLWCNTHIHAQHLHKLAWQFEKCPVSQAVLNTLQNHAAIMEIAIMVMMETWRVNTRRIPLRKNGMQGPGSIATSSGASKGQVWTRHLAPAMPAFTRPSLPSQFIACLTGHLIVRWLTVLNPSLPVCG
jgi:hypothetical protein